jgi:hypothetical protein
MTVKKKLIVNYLSTIDKIFKLKSTYILEKMNAHTVTGNYDLVIMKSVLGGLFRKNDSSLVEVEYFINDLIRRTVNGGGALMSIDNRQSFYEALLSKFGARKYKWRFLKKTEIADARPRSCNLRFRWFWKVFFSFFFK